MTQALSQQLSQHLAQKVLHFAPQVSRSSLSVMPETLKIAAINTLLNRVLAEQLQSDELDFLKHKWVGICVDDIGLRFEVGIAQQLQVRSFTQPDVTLSANVPELILVAAGIEDPDTLFFQRKLRIEGDTELGLQVKNLLLSIELDNLPKPAQIGIEQLAKMLHMLRPCE
ncbi:SCP2 domain-containing protein [Shewanella vesiculosa]|uniref:ubiquinone anaerobic biosynthesis accessory factor UbiT n=1 Tax=Shewanella vesiculosa TaxID=518738 RepID=UPI000F4D34B0|nr:SCP2 sterol-binding domain-containing protein [Shewanella vesiculosa]RPA46005.1 SCP2 domain-containing protein [Shewanella vesiculosa]UJL44444.1 SCP2 sterol-binding domain-containing protein [Shewanella vesiculosa]